MDDEKLIKLVRLHPAIYNGSHKKYADGTYKFQIWNDIARELGESAEVCKSRWNNIRDNFRRSIHKRAHRRSQGRKIRPYKYQQDLSFLVPYFDERITENFKVVADASSHYDDQSDYPECVLSGEVPTSPADTKPTLVSLDTMYQIDPLDQAATSQKDNLFDSVNSSELLSYFMNRNEHPVDKFLASLAPTLKELHPCDLFQVKSELFAVVQKYELKVLKEKFPRQGLGNTPNNLEAPFKVINEFES